jgi:shikimate dehydrogenase
VHAVAAHGSAPTVEAVLIGDAEALAGDVLVSTLPASAQVPDLIAAVAEIPLVFDVVYEPWPTPLVVAAERSGRTVLGGLDLLVAQAVNQVVAMTGRYDVPAGAMRRAAEEALAARSAR